MRGQVWGAALLGVVIGFTTTSWARGIEEKNGKGIFAGHKVGQPVTLKDVSLDESGGTIFGLEASSLTPVPGSGVAVAWDRHPAAKSGLGIRSSTGAWVATAMDPLINKLD